ncbi:MAG: TetR/AcrR family transcriptional regulator [Anaerolineae bacterium]|nr:TetR/AcrR family transcriptional regulator [Anaerolineae bacterium]
MPKLTLHARRALAQARRKQILDAATQVFAEKGFDRATIADVARVAGVAEGSIYNYFKNKDDLLISIPRYVIQPPIESIHTLLDTTDADTLPPPEQMLTLIARNLVTTIRQNAHVFRILLSALPTMSPSTREKYVHHVILYVVRLLEKYFRQQIARGVFRKGLAPDALAIAFVGMFVPVVMLRKVLQIETVPAPDDDRLIATNVSLFLRGALAEPKRAQKIKVE